MSRLLPHPKARGSRLRLTSPVPGSPFARSSRAGTSTRCITRPPPFCFDPLFRGQFAEPWGIAVDGSGNVFVSDRDNVRVQKFACP